ncbi:capsular polysaccharide export protein [Hephaestia caeni]|uniref:Capsular polysaccharide export protein n=1 Tax=Hephaestia caeni TaxID=645617 RepID=A0A397PGB8_9SPHN|nr:capsular biosynthesis protein [Hephaestia caeni]RIA46295.1 capsular polysaccharide export protein [Hephaestia caeni]
MLTERSFLFLQGPPGPFFSQLAGELFAAGHRCHRVNLNGGDWFDWKGRAYNFTGTIETWPTYIQDVIARERVTDIVLFGDCRQHHLEARACAAAVGIVVHVFEEGYIRPDWVTLERNGVNGHSSLPRSAEVYRSLARALPSVPDHARVRPSFRQRASEALGYFLASLLLTLRYRGYRSHRPYPIVAEFCGWAARVVTRPVARLRSAVALRRLGQRRYFLLPLQLDSDHQIRIHSPFTGMQDALQSILRSFAAHAPEEVVLLIKEHPLDNGLHAWRRIVAAMAREHDIAERVFFIEHGDLYTIVGAAAGIVTVNSTTGTLALASGIPVIVLGTAIYDLAGITHQGSLEDFWIAPSMPDGDLYDAFRRVLVARCLLHGGFSSSAARELLLPEAFKRLHGEGVTTVCLPVCTMEAA